MKVRTPPKAPRGKSGLLARAGRALYNDNYITALGELVGRNPRTIRHYLDGNSPIPDMVWEPVMIALNTRKQLVAKLESEVGNQWADQRIVKGN